MELAIARTLVAGRDRWTALSVLDAALRLVVQHDREVGIPAASGLKASSVTTIDDHGHADDAIQCLLRNAVERRSRRFCARRR
ncbi:hypothetical protein [Bradyrhizobium sp. USDA 4502]